MDSSIDIYGSSLNFSVSIIYKLLYVFIRGYIILLYILDEWLKKKNQLKNNCNSHEIALAGCQTKHTNVTNTTLPQSN